MFDGVSNFVNSVDGTFLFSLIVSVFFLVLITFLMIFFVIKYSRKRNPKGKNIHGNIVLEIVWTVIPIILVMIMFWYGWQEYKETVNVPDDAMPINVSAQMWKWSFKYENGRDTDTLYVPVNKAIKLILHSNDVNHAFFVPAFRIKKDIFPNRERIAWFIAKKTGKYHIACAEYCGMNHSYMASEIIVLSEDEFQNWMYGMSHEDTKLLEEMSKSK